MARPVATADTPVALGRGGGASADAPEPARRVRFGGRARDRPPGEPRRVAYLYLIPAALIFGTFTLAPLVHSVWLSLFQWDGITAGKWVGLHNYADVLSDPVQREAFGHALVLLIFYAVIPLLIGLLIAGLVARSHIRGFAFFRVVLFLPQVIALVVVAVMWRMIYDPNDGPINETLRSIGLGGLAKSWLGDFDVALPAVGLIGTWVMYGLAMVLLTAGVQKIPRSLYDAARVDGAGPVREFFAVTLPALRGEIAVALTLSTIAALRNFDLVYITTKGGPGTSTSVPAYQVYERAFLTGKVGSASAMGLMLAALIFVLSAIINRVAERGQAR
ncbi:Diacetylchitobiose uptake system permease protein NgcF [Baekduia alba]|uniref:carbohydrate ABC transporter permease n=1 Tax=Baekduia alba TaxID=2997333 RepID=UPI0023427B6F|nr:sugar ABC transporter permease [Baekduia alba]WCB96480.1 Diacetylchitobiose uptake system permease protein NgcF [Baekduia alba]